MAIDGNGFDRDFYLSKNPDVAASKLDPYQHYIQYGWREGRDPNPIFDVEYYFRANPDVAASGVNPLTHYMAYGWLEGRDPSVAFDMSDYRAANPDVAAAGLNPLLHYLAYGQFEHRALAPDYRGELREGFDRGYYLAANPDVARNGADPYIHYQAYGKDEGRSPNAFFDKTFYLAHNPDVAAAGIDPFQHFLTFGWREGRDPSADFSLLEYRAATGAPASDNPLLNYLTADRYSSLPSELTMPNTPQIIQARGNALNPILAGHATFAIDGALTHVSAPSSPLDGYDLSGFSGYSLGRSIADITITGTGRFPIGLDLGTGDDRITGVFNLDGQILNLSAGGGTLTVDAQFDNGSGRISGGTDGSDVIVRGNATLSFDGGSGADIVTLGAGNNYISGGGGVNVLDGGAGTDLALWGGQVSADLLTGRAISLSGSGFEDTLISIEDLLGSPFNDNLRGDNRENKLSGANGDDILAGRGGDDDLWGMDGADILIGGRGSDRLYGENGKDLLIDAADGWSANLYKPNANPYAYGNEGDDTFVFLLGEVGQEGRGNFMAGGIGADTYIIDPSQGRWGSLGLEFSQIDGDTLDLSALRTLAGGAVTLGYVKSAASTPFYGSTTIDLSAFHDANGNALLGRIVLNSVFSPSDLHESDFILQGGENWRALLPDDMLALI